MKIFFIFFMFAAIVSRGQAQEKHVISGSGGYGVVFSERTREFNFFNPIMDNTEKWGIEQTVFAKANISINNSFEIFGQIYAGTTVDGYDSIITTYPQLYVKYSLSSILFLVAGKQRVGWGNGKLFTVINELEQPPNPLRMVNEEHGFYGISFLFAPLYWVGVHGVVVPGESFGRTKAALKLDLLLFDVDAQLGLILNHDLLPQVEGDSLTIVQNHKETVFLNLIRYFGNKSIYGDVKFSPNYNNRYAQATNTTPTLHSFDEGFNRKVTGLIGCSWQMQEPIKMNLGLEFLFNGRGLLAHESIMLQTELHSGRFDYKMLSTSLKNSARQIGGLRRNYFGGFFSLTHQQVSAGASIHFSVDAREYLTSPYLSFKPNENFELSVNWDMVQRTNNFSELDLVGFENRVAVFSLFNF